MDNKLYKEFEKAVDQYSDTLELPQDEQKTEYVESMLGWVKENMYCLACETVQEVLYDYIDMLNYRDGVYRDYVFPDGESEYYDDPEGYIIFDGDKGSEEAACIEEILRFLGDES